MSTKRLSLVAAVAAVVVLTSSLVAAQSEPFRIVGDGSSVNARTYPDFGQGVVSGNAGFNPFPTESLINNYLFQDEQINVDPSDGLIKVMRTDQKINVTDYIVATFPVKEASARELREVFRTVARKEGGSAEIILDAVKKQYYIYVVAPEWQLPYIEKAVKALDEEWVSEYNDGSADLFYKPVYREAEFVDLIAGLWGGTLGNSEVDDHNNTIFRSDEPYRVANYMKGAKLVDIPEHEMLLEGAIYELNVTNDLKLGLDYIAWKNGPGRNLFDFLIAGEETDHNFRGASNLNDPHMTGTFGGRVIDTAIGPDGHLVDERRDYEAGIVQEYYSANFLLTAAYFDFLSSKGKAKVLDRPVIRTRSGSYGTWSNMDQLLAFEAADLIDVQSDVVDQNLTTNPGSLGTFSTKLTSLGFSSFGGAIIVDPDNQFPPHFLTDDEGDEGGEESEFQFVRQSETGRGFGDANVSPRTLRYKNAGQVGLFLRILPMVGVETSEVLIDFASSDLNGYSPQGLPILNTRTYSTTVRVADRQPFVVGGLRRAEKVKFKQGAPFLSELPIIGWLAGGETSINRENDVALVLEPTINLGDPSDVAIPAEFSNVMAQASGDAEITLPSNPFGFDQWLLDSEK